jgi:16S rRNA (adenine1518-N6/adenine1519-N6)-dimethyltransferase
MPARRRAKWGQHFLKDESLCRKIADSLQFETDDLAVEIGPGRGVMTRLLAARARRLVAIEIDTDLAQKLAEDFSAAPEVKVLAADILETDFSSLLVWNNAKCCYVFGNLPYYITSPILRHLFDARRLIRHMTLLMQREVAERVTASPGSRAYGYLSIIAQLDSAPRITLVVPPGAFSPPPKVHSALVDFPISARFPLWTDRTRQSFLEFVETCFHQKRKSLLNNLARKYTRGRVEGIIQTQGLDSNVRAEQIDINGLVEIFTAVMTGEQ